MKNKISLIALSLVTFLGLNVNAQKTAVAVTAGTQGAGVDLKYSPAPNYGIRLGGSILPFKTDFVFTTGSTPADVDLKADFQNAHVIFDWHPFRHGQGFRKFMLSAGAGYFWKNKGRAILKTQDTYAYGDIVIGPDDAGELIGEVRWKQVAPYAGIGFESAIPTTKFNMGFSLGAYYLGEPATRLTGTKLVSVDGDNQAQFHQNMKDYRFLPVIQLNFNYALN